MAESTDPTTVLPNLYHPLDVNTQELRLLEICPSEVSSSPIQVKIFPRRFEDVRGQFIPFSYVWGDPIDTETIIINEIPRKIPKNLSLFLRQIRAFLPDILAEIPWEKPALFWADSICINQDDTEERNHQVRLMSSIYGTAPAVLSWLGHTEDSDLALDIPDACVRWLYACKERNPEWAGPGSWDPNFDGWMERCPQFWEFFEYFGETNPYWEALRTLLELPYWKRTWIFQEITLPAATFLMYGSALIKTPSLVALHIWLSEFAIRPASNFPFLGQGNYHKLLITLADQQRPTLALVPILGSLRASDPRDKIFGLLGVMDTQLVADYQKPVVQVYCEFVSAWMREVQDLNFLLDAYRMPHMQRSTGEPGLPSWAPDWGGTSWALNLARETPEFSRFWREEIFGNVKSEELEDPEVAHWEDGTDAFRWAWENHRAKIEHVQLESLYHLTRNVKFLTKSNYIGVASSAEVGDKVVVLGGCGAPMLLRPKDGHYEHIGPCFVLGLMGGKAKEMVDRGEAKLERFEIH
ncbi:hypothetical protein CEP53_011130 [Fusarium sp. AF-6]|nr:hypothetical protein CEP53_011130 [Fusarium sp. AF-6]